MTATAPSYDRAVRAVTVAAGAALVLETSLFSVLAPLLAGYTDEFGLSKAGAGVLAASYGAGVLIGGLPGGALATRIGCRATTLLGLGLMAVASAGFGLAPSAELLVGTRFAQGFAGGMIWVACLAWVSVLSPDERRGEALGRLVGIALVGSLMGPVLGAVAEATSTEAVFLAIPAFCAGLIALLLRLPADRGAPARTRMFAVLSPGASGRERAVVAGWLIFVSAVGYGLVLTIGPLRLDGLGVGSAAVGAIFLGAAGAQALVTPLAGRLVDRRGAGAVLLPALVGGAVVGLLVALPEHAAILAAVIIVLVAANGLFLVPGALLLREATGRAGLSDGQSMALFNLAWALGQAGGASGSGVVAELTSDFTACLLVSVAYVATFAVLTSARGRRLLAVEAA